MVDNHEGKYFEQWLTNHNLTVKDAAERLKISGTAVRKQFTQAEMAKSFKIKLNKAGLDVWEKAATDDLTVIKEKYIAALEQIDQLQREIRPLMKDNLRLERDLMKCQQVMLESKSAR